MTYLEAIILGFFQGIAEFLPISSGGHLSILQSFFGIDADKIMLFSILLHIGTLASVVLVYFKDLVELVKELILTIKDIIAAVKSFRAGNGLRLKEHLKIEERPVRKLGFMIITACIPTALIGLIFNDAFGALYSNPSAIACCFIITGLLLLLTDKFKSYNRTITNLNYRNALFIGVIQGLATIPGISRSGSTIFGGLLCRLDREFATKFIFLLSIPAVFGATLLEVPEAIAEGVDTALIGPIFVGMLVAFVSGLFAIKFMVKLVKACKLKYFAIYLFAVSVVVFFADYFIRIKG